MVADLDEVEADFFSPYSLTNHLLRPEALGKQFETDLHQSSPFGVG
jgi:hypothetical protein